MFLNNLIEFEDLTSLQLIDLTVLPDLDREIVQHILKTGTFSAYDIGKNLSMKHAVRYMDLCEGKAYQKVKEDLQKHITKINNLEKR